jgi:uncharacterized glyoxalase superfamily protein PhnB
MNLQLPVAIPEIPVSKIDAAVAYYRDNLGFNHDWGDVRGEIAGMSKGDCRIFLTNPAFRQTHGNAEPVRVWLNLGSRDEVDELHRGWSATGAKIAAPPESKPWNLHEFTATDLDGNLLRVFHDFAWEASSAPAEAT